MRFLFIFVGVLIASIIISILKIYGIRLGALEYTLFACPFFLIPNHLYNKWAEKKKRNPEETENNNDDNETLDN